jgi:hypothetical protein
MIISPNRQENAVGIVDGDQALAVRLDGREILSRGKAHHSSRRAADRPKQVETPDRG